MSFGFGPSITSFGMRANSGPTDPDFQYLTGFWRGQNYDYPTFALPGTASAGTSSAENMSDYTYGGIYKPTVGATLNGFNTIDSTGSAFVYLETQNTLANFITSTSACLIILAKVTSISTTGAIPYQNSMIFGSIGDYFGIYARNIGGIPTVLGFAYDNADKFEERVITLNTWNVYQLLIDGGKLYFRINKNGWSNGVSIAGGGITNLTNKFATAGLGLGNPLFSWAEAMTGIGFTKADCEGMTSYLSNKYDLGFT